MSTKFHSTRSNPAKPSVVKEYGFWWARTRTEEGFQASLHHTHQEAFNAAQRMAGAAQ